MKNHGAGIRNATYLCLDCAKNMDKSWNITALFIIHVNFDHMWAALGAKRDFLSLFNLPPLEGSESLGLQTWFVSSLDLLLHRSNVRTLSKPPVPSGEPPKRGIKRRFSNAIDAAARPAHAGCGRGPRFAASVVG